MKKQQIIVTCQYGEEAADIRAIILQSFLLLLSKELSQDGHILANTSLNHV